MVVETEPQKVLTIDDNLLYQSLGLACEWLMAIAQVKTKGLTIEKNSQGFVYDNWSGAIRGEYSVRLKEWDFFCPVWHTGQAVKALVMAHRITSDKSFLDAAVAGADFICRNQLRDKSSTLDGLILAYENKAGVVNTSAILESLDGLIFLADETGDDKWFETVVRALRWVSENAYIKDGLFRDFFDVNEKRFLKEFPGHRTKDNAPGHPLIDDGVFLKGYRKSSDKKFQTIFYETTDRLLRDEDPPGNWVHYSPNNANTGYIHPRHAYWWGMPMLMAYQDSGQQKYLDQAIRCGEWYLRAQRRDGGIFRATYTDGKTDSFGHAASGVACAIILWTKLLKETQDRKYMDAIHLGINYCLNMQFVRPGDTDLKGCILEKVLPPDGSDRNPYYIRDLGTIFFIQADCTLLEGLK